MADSEQRDVLVGLKTGHILKVPFRELEILTEEHPSPTLVAHLILNGKTVVPMSAVAYVKKIKHPTDEWEDDDDLQRPGH